MVDLLHLLVLLLEQSKDLVLLHIRANLTQGATISHGLTQKPDFAIFKNRDSTSIMKLIGVYITLWWVQLRDLTQSKCC